MQLKNVEEYIKARNKNARYGNIWRSLYSGKHRVGPCIALCCKYRPQTYQEFMDAYVDDAIKNKNLPLNKRGRTIEEFKDLCVTPYFEHVKKYTNSEDLNYETFFDEAICHVIIETFDGRKHEIELEKYCEEKGYSIEYPSNEDDSKNGIDFFCCQNNEKKFMIQVKPLSFFISTRSDTISDKLNAFSKANNAIKKYGIPYYFTIYDSKGKKWCKNELNESSVLYRIKDLYQEDGSFKVGKMDDLTGCTENLT